MHQAVRDLPIRLARGELADSPLLPRRQGERQIPAGERQGLHHALLNSHHRRHHQGQRVGPVAGAEPVVQHGVLARSGQRRRRSPPHLRRPLERQPQDLAPLPLDIQGLQPHGLERVEQVGNALLGAGRRLQQFQPAGPRVGLSLQQQDPERLLRGGMER